VAVVDVFDLFAKIKLDSSGYEKGLNAAKELGGKVAGGIATAFKASATAITGVGAGLTALTKQTLNAVGEFEQLEGGARKIFDEMDFDKISRDAKNAYRELNMSASEYLESINLAGATFAQTMGDEKGYDTARKGMLAIADFASGTGKNLTELNQKYQLITRSASGYQSIADQFAGILPQTSADFLDAAKAAGLLKNEYEELKKVPVAEYQQAVTEMLVKGVENLGLSNNTLRESTETLTGSFAMAKAAWKNFMTGTSDVKTFKDAFTSAIDNTVKNLDTIVPRLSDGLIQLSDALAPEIPRIIENTLPTIITSTSTLVTGLAERLPDILQMILPSLVSGTVRVVSAFVTALPRMIKPLGSAVKVIGDELISRKDELLTAGGELMDMVISPLKKNSAKIGETAVTFVSNLASKIADARVLENIGAVADDVVNGLAAGLTSQTALDAFFHAAPKILTGLADGIKNFLVGENNESGLAGALESILNNIATWFEDENNRKYFLDSAGNFIDSLGESLLLVVNKVPDILLSAGRALLDVFIGGIDYDHGADQFWSSLLSSIWNSAKRWELPFSGDKIHIQEMWGKYGGSMGYDEFEKKWYDSEDFGDWLFGMSDDERMRKMGLSYRTGNAGASDYVTEHYDEIQERTKRIEQEEEEAARKKLSDLQSQTIWQNSPLLQKEYDNYVQSHFVDGFSDLTTSDLVDVVEGLINRRRQELRQKNQISDFLKDTGTQGVPFAEGGIVTKPTLAWIGEKGEKEAVVPLEHETETSRALGLGGINITFGDIYVQGGASPEIADNLIQQIDEKLRTWQIMQKRGVGSTAWQH